MSTTQTDLDALGRVIAERAADLEGMGLEFPHTPDDFVLLGMAYSREGRAGYNQRAAERAARAQQRRQPQLDAVIESSRRYH